MKKIIAKVAVSLLIGGIVLVASTPASAWVVGLDFITGGGWFFINHGGAALPVPPTCGAIGSYANFGWHGGVKNGAFWGNGNFLDHGCGLHVHSQQVLDYICTSGPCPATSTKTVGTREICGIATASIAGASATFHYRVRMHDEAEPGAGVDKFGIILYDPNQGDRPVYFAEGDPINGGNIQLHKANPSNTAPNPSGVCESLAAHGEFFTFD